MRKFMGLRSGVSVTSNPEILSLRAGCAVLTAKFMPLSCASSRNPDQPRDRRKGGQASNVGSSATFHLRSARGQRRGDICTARGRRTSCKSFWILFRSLSQPNSPNSHNSQAPQRQHKNGSRRNRTASSTNRCQRRNGTSARSQSGSRRAKVLGPGAPNRPVCRFADWGFSLIGPLLPRSRSAVTPALASSAATAPPRRGQARRDPGCRGRNPTVAGAAARARRREIIAQGARP